jgi:hypothetical protein
MQIEMSAGLIRGRHNHASHSQVDAYAVAGWFERQKGFRPHLNARAIAQRKNGAASGGEERLAFSDPFIPADRPRFRPGNTIKSPVDGLGDGVDFALSADTWHEERQSADQNDNTHSSSRQPHAPAVRDADVVEIAHAWIPRILGPKAIQHLRCRLVYLLIGWHWFVQLSEYAVEIVVTSLFVHGLPPPSFISFLMRARARNS